MKKIDCALIVDVLEGVYKPRSKVAKNRKTILTRYRDLKTTVDFVSAARQAKIEWLESYLQDISLNV